MGTAILTHGVHMYIHTYVHGEGTYTHSIHTYMYIRDVTICLFVILHVVTSNIAIYCTIAILVYNFM